MESFLNRYRHITVLVLVICAQLVLLAVQVKNDQDVRMIRIWTISVVTPVARLVEGLRGGSAGFLHNYVTLHDTNAENRRLKEELGRYKLENIFLKNELNKADRAQALQIFQSSTPSKTLAANVIAMAPGNDSKMVTVDRGSLAGVERGMAVVTPDGIVGKVTAAFPTASMVQLVTDAEFAAGVISQKNQVRGTLKGQGTPTCKVDYVPVEEKVEVGEVFYTSGDDRIFPRGFPAGIVRSVKNGSNFKQIFVDPLGIQHGLEDVLIILQGVHQEIPEVPAASQPVYLAPPVPATTSPAPGNQTTSAPPVGTEADKVRGLYKAIGEAENHTFGEGAPGTKPPDFNAKLPGLPPGTPPSGPGTGLGSGMTLKNATPQQQKPPVTPQNAPSANKPPDAVRHANQAAGAPPGGIPKE